MENQYTVVLLDGTETCTFFVEAESSKDAFFNAAAEWCMEPENVVCVAVFAGHCPVLYTDAQ